MSAKYFPLDLQNKIENGTCCIKFGIRDINDADIQEDIYLYMPPGINIPDGATYNNVNLGLIGAATRDVVDSNADTLSDQDFNSTDFITAVTKRIQGDGMGGLGAQNALAGIELGRGEVTNPYTAVQFDGVTVRNFTFNFRLISESAEEAIAIKNIEDLGMGDYEFALYDPAGPYQIDQLFENVRPGIHNLYVRDKKGCGIAVIELSLIHI